VHVIRSAPSHLRSSSRVQWLRRLRKFDRVRHRDGTWQLSYDGLNRLTAATDPDRHTSYTYYFASGAISKTETPVSAGAPSPPAACRFARTELVRHPRVHGWRYRPQVEGRLLHAGNRESLGFRNAVENAFKFLENYGYHIVESTTTLVRYEGNGRYVQVFHGRQSYAIGAHFGDVGMPESDVSLEEILSALRGCQSSPAVAAWSTESIAIAVGRIAEQVQGMRGVLHGDRPMEAVSQHRKHLTDYYSGKSPNRPSCRRLP